MCVFNKQGLSKCVWVMSSLKTDLEVWKHRCNFIQGQTLLILSDSHLISCSSVFMLLSPLPVSKTVWLDVFISLHKLTKDLNLLLKQINSLNIPNRLDYYDECIINYYLMLVLYYSSLSLILFICLLLYGLYIIKF